MSDTDEALRLLRYLVSQYDRVVTVHSQVVMDTPEDRALHAKAVDTFQQAVAPVRDYLAALADPETDDA